MIPSEDWVYNKGRSNTIKIENAAGNSILKGAVNRRNAAAIQLAGKNKSTSCRAMQGGSLFLIPIDQ